MNKIKNFINIEGEWINVNCILSVQRWNFDRHKSIITFVNGDQRTVSESLTILMMTIDEAVKDE